MAAAGAKLETLAGAFVCVCVCGRVKCGAGLMATETPVDCQAVLHFSLPCRLLPAACCLPFGILYIACGLCGKHEQHT